MKIYETLIIGGVTCAGSFITTSFAIGQYKAKVDVLETNQAITAKGLNDLMLEVKDRLGRIEQKLDDDLGK